MGDDASYADVTGSPADPAGVDLPALDEDTAERLLAGDLDPAQAPPGYAEVAAVLAAAAAEPSPDELAGQAAAVVELRTAARARHAARSRRAGRLGSRRRIGLAVAVVVGSLSTGGIAAATGHLPEPIREVTRSVLTVVGGAAPGTVGEPGRPPATSTAGPGASSATTPGQGTPQSSAAGHGRDGPGPTVTPTVAGAAMNGRCRAFLAGKGNKTDAAAFQALAAAAGGEDKIASYCQQRRPDGAAKGRGKSAPPSTAGNHGHGQGGPPPQRAGHAHTGRVREPNTTVA